MVDQNKLFSAIHGLKVGIVITLGVDVLLQWQAGSMIQAAQKDWGMIPDENCVYI